MATVPEEETVAIVPDELLDPELDEELGQSSGQFVWVSQGYSQRPLPQIVKHPEELEPMGLPLDDEGPGPTPEMLALALFPLACDALVTLEPGTPSTPCRCATAEGRCRRRRR